MQFKYIFSIFWSLLDQNYSKIDSKWSKLDSICHHSHPKSIPCVLFNGRSRRCFFFTCLVSVSGPAKSKNNEILTEIKKNKLNFMYLHDWFCHVVGAVTNFFWKRMPLWAMQLSDYGPRQMICQCFQPQKGRWWWRRPRIIRMVQKSFLFLDVLF